MDITEIVLYLASSSLPYITGAEFVFDGGLSIEKPIWNNGY